MIHMRYINERENGCEQHTKSNGAQWEEDEEELLLDDADGDDGGLDGSGLIIGHPRANNRPCADAVVAALISTHPTIDQSPEQNGTAT